MIHKTISWEVAKELADRLDLDQVIVWAWQREGSQHLLTYGKTVKDSDQAAQGGNHIKTALLGWPASLALAVPDRVEKCREALERAKVALSLFAPKRQAETIALISEALALFTEPREAVREKAGSVHEGRVP